MMIKMDDDEVDLETKIHKTYNYIRSFLDRMKEDVGLKVVQYLPGVKAYDPVSGVIYNSDNVGRLESVIIKRLCVYIK